MPSEWEQGAAEGREMMSPIDGKRQKNIKTSPEEEKSIVTEVAPHKIDET